MIVSSRPIGGMASLADDGGEIAGRPGGGQAGGRRAPSSRRK
jgi:hypothetical protein